MFTQRTKIFTFVATLAIVFGAFGSPAEAFHSWGDYHWARTANPFTLKLGDNVSSAWDAHLGVASADWTASNVLDTTIVPGLTIAKRCKPTNGRVEVCASAYGKNGWLGIAQIWISGSHITQGIVKVNDSYFNTATYNNPNEKLHVMCQEIGHTLGLDHQSVDGSSQDTCMDYFSNTGVNATSTLSTHPNAHDYEQLETIYAHLDSITTIVSNIASRAFQGNGDVDTSDPKEWGKETKDGVDHHSTMRESHYERDLGKGQKLLTFVTWAN